MATAKNTTSKQKKKKKRKKGSKAPGRYAQIIRKLFFDKYKPGLTRLDFTSAEVEEAKKQFLKKASGTEARNKSDVLYHYRYRGELPEDIRKTVNGDQVWIIRGTGQAMYRFEAVARAYAYIRPRDGLTRIKVPDQTPGIIAQYALDDEQALLAKIRYNRLVDIFTGIAASSLQSHLRTKVADVGQVEVDEVYVGVNRHGVQYVLPVQAKGREKEKNVHNIVQIEQDIAMCRTKPKFKSAVCLPIAATLLEENVIALMTFTFDGIGTASILDERHYELVPLGIISAADLLAYQQTAQGTFLPAAAPPPEADATA